MASPQSATLVENTVTTLTFTEVTTTPRTARVTVEGDSSSRVYFRTDGTDPVIDAAGCHVLLGGQPGRKDVPIVGVGSSYTATVKLISAGTPFVTVEIL